MLLAVDVGNTQTVFGLFDDGTLQENWRVATEAQRTGDELGALVGRFIDATERRLVEEGEEPEAAAAKAFVLCWMTNHACYQQHARSGSLDDLALLDALTDILERSVYGP